MQNYYVGLDVHSRESVFVVEDDAGAIVARGSVPTTVAGLKHLRDSCGLPVATGVALETGTSAFFVARELVRLELKPIVIDAHEGAQYACIERIGLGELASSAGEIACLAPAVLRFRLAVANSNLMLSSDSLESGSGSSNLLRSTIQSIVFCFSKNRFRLRFGQR
jgi:hypothetical protein